MSEQTQMMRVYPEDREKLTALFGKPTQVALRKLLVLNCQHPEAARSYTIAFVADDMNENEQPQMRSGFLCRECGRYIFAVEQNHDIEKQA